MLRVVLASASPARATLLRQAGVEAQQLVSAVDEDAVQLGLGPAATPTEVVAALARAKAMDVARSLGPEPGERLIVIGCDSVLDLDGRPLGKPRDRQDATARWRAMRGRSGALRTGHAVIDVGADRMVDAVESTLVRFAHPSDDEIEAYIGTGEPLRVAGAFTLDGYGAPFVASIDGDPSNVIGLSLPLLRRLLADLGIAWPDLWRR
jgi:septum formation protein